MYVGSCSKYRMSELYDYSKKRERAGTLSGAGMVAVQRERIAETPAKAFPHRTVSQASADFFRCRRILSAETCIFERKFQEGICNQHVGMFLIEFLNSKEMLDKRNT